MVELEGGRTIGIRQRHWNGCRMVLHDDVGNLGGDLIDRSVTNGAKIIASQSIRDAEQAKAYRGA